LFFVLCSLFSVRALGTGALPAAGRRALTPPFSRAQARALLARTLLARALQRRRRAAAAALRAWAAAGEAAEAERAAAELREELEAGQAALEAGHVAGAEALREARRARGAALARMGVGRRSRAALARALRAWGARAERAAAVAQACDVAGVVLWLSPQVQARLGTERAPAGRNRRSDPAARNLFLFLVAQDSAFLCLHAWRARAVLALAAGGASARATARWARAAAESAFDGWAAAGRERRATFAHVMVTLAAAVRARLARPRPARALRRSSILFDLF
jgi:hypothetical protein